MKSFFLLLIGLGAGIAGTVVFIHMQKASPSPTPIVESTPAKAPEQPQLVKVVVQPAPAAVQVVEATPAPVATNSAANSADSEAAAAFRKTIDKLLSPQITAREKHEMFEQFRTSGQLDPVIAELKRRATDDPTNPEIPTTLGEALLNKVRQLHESGADVNEVGILAMQADQSFNAALKIDPSNWEAQFVKYSTMVYWPAEPKRDNEAAEKLSHLIDQQETMPQQPGFAQTYIALGNQYQKMGKTDFAETTWRLGLSKFPNDPTLQKKLAPHP